MNALPLEPAGYAGTYKLVGGRPSLDLVNTLAWPGTEREHDWFEPWTNVLEWSVATGVLAARDLEALRRHYTEAPHRLPPVLDAIKHRRSVLRSALAPIANGRRPEESAISALNEILETASASRRIEPSSLDYTWRTPTGLDDLCAAAVLDAAELVVDAAARRRLGSCPACAWLFYDKSRNRSRRWCDMADCGSRDKALRYYHRSKES